MSSLLVTSSEATQEQSSRIRPLSASWAGSGRVGRLPIMPHRNAQFRELCLACKRPAATECHRCSAPLCGTHSPSTDRRCQTCEREYRRRIGRPRVIVRAVGVSVVWAAIALLGVSAGAGTAIMGLAAAIGMGVSLERTAEPIRAHRTFVAKQRQKFLAEQIRPPLPEHRG